MADLSKVLFIGAEGMAGSYVDFGIRPPESELNVTDRRAVFSHFERYLPSHVVHLAAETDLEVCEKDPDRAYEVNTLGTYHVAQACRKYGAKLIYISTAGVFDGEKPTPYTEEDIPRPRNMYGKTKYFGEMIVRDTVPNHLIIRTCWVFGGGPKKDKKFVAKIIRQLNQPEIRAVDDKFGSPCYWKDLVARIRSLIVEDAEGTIHLANEGAASRFDVAKAVVEILNMPVRVVPVSSEYFGFGVKRANSEVLASKTGFLRPWREALAEYLNEEWKGHIPNPA